MNEALANNSFYSALCDIFQSMLHKIDKNLQEIKIIWIRLNSVYNLLYIQSKSRTIFWEKEKKWIAISNFIFFIPPPEDITSLTTLRNDLFELFSILIKTSKYPFQTSTSQSWLNSSWRSNEGFIKQSLPRKLFQRPYPFYLFSLALNSLCPFYDALKKIPD